MMRSIQLSAGERTTMPAPDPLLLLEPSAYNLHVLSIDSSARCLPEVQPCSGISLVGLGENSRTKSANTWPFTKPSGERTTMPAPDPLLLLEPSTYNLHVLFVDSSARCLPEVQPYSGVSLVGLGENSRTKSANTWPFTKPSVERTTMPAPDPLLLLEPSTYNLHVLFVDSSARCLPEVQPCSGVSLVGLGENSRTKLANTWPFIVVLR